MISLGFFQVLRGSNRLQDDEVIMFTKTITTTTTTTNAVDPNFSDKSSAYSISTPSSPQQQQKYFSRQELNVFE
jgi:hypothetical protein